MSEAVNHPQHYQANGIEVIEMIEALGFGEGFCIGNAIKYAGRAGKKDSTKYVEDLEKAVWYLKRRIETAQAERDGRETVRPNDMNPRPFPSLTDHTAKLIEEERRKASSAMRASTSFPPAPEPPTATASDASEDMVLHGTWYEITPEGQGKKIAFIADEPLPTDPNKRLEWLAGLNATIKIYIDGGQDADSEDEPGERPIDYVRGEHA
jgi:hypothetical protein